MRRRHGIPTGITSAGAADVLKQPGHPFVRPQIEVRAQVMVAHIVVAVGMIAPSAFRRGVRRRAAHEDQPHQCHYDFHTLMPRSLIADVFVSDALGCELT